MWSSIQRANKRACCWGKIQSYLTVNDLINANFQINTSYLTEVPSYLLQFCTRPSLTNAPCLIDALQLLYSKILGISKKEQIIQSFSFLLV